jgi:hypothetical protein
MLRSVANTRNKTVIATFAQSMATYAMCLCERDADQTSQDEFSLLTQGIETGLKCGAGSDPERCIDMNFGALWPLIDELRTHSRV